MQAAIIQWTQPLAEALLNGLWQGLLLAALAWLFLRLNPSTGAAGRYAVLYTTLVVILCLPALNLVTRSTERQAESISAEAGSSSVAEERDLARFSYRSSPAPLASFPIELPASALPGFFVLGWFAMAAILCARLCLACLALQRLKRNSRPVQGRHHSWWRGWMLASPSLRRPELRVAATIRLPLTAGLTSPAILFPARLLAHLSEEEARVIWLHELAHVRRLDDWTKLGQKLAESVMFYHPAVRWLGRRLELEREIACDEWVVAQTGAPKPYAACLAKLAEYAAASPASCPAPAMAAEKKQIFRRVSMLTNKEQDRNESRAFGLLAAGLLLAVAGAMVAADPVLVFADTPREASETRPVLAPVNPAPPSSVEAELAAPALPAEPAHSTEVRAAVAGVTGGQSGVVGQKPVLAVLAPAAPPAPPAVLGGLQEPPAPPDPPKAPKPAPRPEPAPRPKLAPDSEASEAHRAEMRAVREEMAKQREEMRALGREMREKMRTEIEPRQQEMKELSRELRDKVRTELEPEIDRIRELSRELAREHRSDEVNEERMNEIKDQLAELEHEIQEKTTVQMEALEELIEVLEKEMRPSEEVMHNFEEKMKEVEKRMQEKAEKMIELERKFREKERGPQTI